MPSTTTSIIHGNSTGFRFRGSCLTVSTGLALSIAATLLLLYTTLTPAPHPRLRAHSPLTDTDLVSPIWRRLGCPSVAAMPRCVRKANRRALFEALVDEYLAPWSPAVAGAPPVRISAALLNSMELPFVERTVGRVRLTASGGVHFRVLQHWDKTYRVPRFAFFLSLVERTLHRYPGLKGLSSEFYVNVADGPRVTVDSASAEYAALPLFSLRTSQGHIDIPVPDPVEHGSPVTGAGYVLPVRGPRWVKRSPRLVFRGTSSCLASMHDDNWHLSPRVRVAAISTRFPSLIDAGVSKWIKLSRNTTVADITASANITTKKEMSLGDQLRFKFLLDVDGGLGSSRKRWMLLSGSTPFFQASTVYQWYEPLLVPWVHFVPVDKWFRNLVQHILWARNNDRKARKIARNAQDFAHRFLSDEAILEYTAVLLGRYGRLVQDVPRSNASVPYVCGEAPSLAAGPMGCRTDWFKYTKNESFPFGCLHLPKEHLSFLCYRQHPVNRKPEVKHGIHTSYENDFDIKWRAENKAKLGRKSA